MAENDYYEKGWFYSDIESSETSGSFSDEDLSDLPWLQKVEPSGELFYIEDNSHIEVDFSKTASDSEDDLKPSVKSATEKLKKWMKKQKIQKNLFKSSKYIENIDDSMEFNPLSFYSHDVFLEASSQTFSLKENFAWEILGLQLELDEKSNNSYKTDKMKILGFVSDHKHSGLKIGDWLHSINDEIVNGCNINEVLSKIDLSAKIKLTVMSPFYEKCELNNSLLNQSSIFHELLGTFDVVSEMKSFFHNIHAGVFFLKQLVGSEDKTVDNETVYKYPDKSSTLCFIKGIFITLDHLIKDVASPLILSCTLSIQESMVHVGFFKERNSIFLLAVPAECATEKEVQYLVKNIAKLLKLMFSSLEIVFSSEDFKNRLDKIFSLFYKHFLFKKSENMICSPPHLYEILPSVHWVPLSVELKMEIDDTLNEMESSDFDCSSDGFFENQRTYNILGSCIFYKGYLLSNHLLKDDFLDIYLYLHYHHLLLLTKIQAVSEIIVWKEIFPSRFQEKCSGNFETRNRFFLLVIAMNHCVIAVMLEAGGAAIVAEANPPPQPFYVEEVQNTLLILHNYGIISAIEKWLCLQTPTLPDAFLKDFSYPVTISSAYQRAMPCSLSHNSLSCDKGQADGKSDIESDYSDTSVDNSSVLCLKSGNLNVATRSISDSPGSSIYSNPCQSGNNITISSDDIVSYSASENTCFLTLGNVKNLFHFLHLDPVEGVFLAPLVEDRYNCHDSLFSNILLNFHRTCVHMRTVFSRSLRNEEIQSSKIVTKFGINDFLHCTSEQGVLFCYTDKDKNKQRNPLNFWIIGRLFFTPEPREVYVCYPDSIQQDIVELAFQLGFGLSL